MKTHSIPYLCLLFISCIAIGCAAKPPKPPEPIPPALPDIRKGILQTALSLKGKPYQKSGKGPKSFDCSGFVSFVYKKSNITLPPSTDEMSGVGQKISLRNVMPGDLVFFKTMKFFHVGIMLNKREFIHASTRKGITVDRIDSYYWRRMSHHFRKVL